MKLKTLEDVKYIYGADDLVKIVNIKQILFYTRNGLQPVFVEEGYNSKLVAWFCKSDTKDLWGKWLENDPNKTEKGE